MWPLNNDDQGLSMVHCLGHTDSLPNSKIVPQRSLLPGQPVQNPNACITVFPTDHAVPLDSRSFPKVWGKPLSFIVSKLPCMSQVDYVPQVPTLDVFLPMLAPYLNREWNLGEPRQIHLIHPRQYRWEVSWVPCLTFSTKEPMPQKLRSSVMSMESGSSLMSVSSDVSIMEHLYFFMLLWNWFSFRVASFGELGLEMTI